MHEDRQPLSTHSHINWIEEAFLLASSKRRVCCAAAPCRLGPELAVLLQWADAAVPGCGATQHSPPSFPPCLRPRIAPRGPGSPQTKNKLSAFSAGLRDGSHFPSYILPSLFYFRYPAWSRNTLIFTFLLFNKFPFRGDLYALGDLRPYEPGIPKSACFQGKREHGAAFGTGCTARPGSLGAHAAPAGRRALPPAAPRRSRPCPPLPRHPARAGAPPAPGQPGPREGGRPPPCPAVPSRAARGPMAAERKMKRHGRRRAALQHEAGRRARPSPATQTN